jgi:hypothetical protein
MMRKLKVTRIMYNRQVASSHTANARLVVMNINQADECKSCHHKTIKSTKNKLLKAHTALSTEADVTGSATNGEINTFLSVIIAGLLYNLFVTREKDLVTNYNLL